MSIEQQLKEIDELEIKLSELKKKLLLNIGEKFSAYFFEKHSSELDTNSVYDLYNIYNNYCTDDNMYMVKNAWVRNKEYIKYFNKNLDRVLQEKIYHILMNHYLTQQEKDTFINLLIIEH